MMINADRLTRWIAIAVIVSLAGISVACGTLQGSATIATPGSATDAVARNAIEGGGLRPDPTAIAVPEPTATPTREAPPAESSYLESTVEPCRPVGSSGLDPCHRRFDDWDVVDTPFIQAMTMPLKGAPTIESVLSEWFFSESYVIPHLFVRATVIPGSTRCNEADKMLVSTFHEPPFIEEHPEDTCFSELKVNEYIVGRGPGRLTISVGHIFKVEGFRDSETYYDWLEGIYSVFEGSEWVLGLHVPLDVTYSAWRISDHPWDLQRRDDGTLVVVDWMARTQPRDLPRDQNGFEVTLEEFRVLATSVHRDYSASNSARIGDFEGAPFILNDANDEFLHSYLSHAPVFSILDATPQAPPPAPGQGDPYTPGQNIGDPTPTASPEVPGGLEDTPTPVSALGDEPTATTAGPTAIMAGEPTTTPKPEPDARDQP